MDSFDFEPEPEPCDPALYSDFIQAWLAGICDMESPCKRTVTPPEEVTETNPQLAGPSTRLRTRLARTEKLIPAPLEQDIDATPRPGPWSQAQQSSRSLDPSRPLEGSPTKKSTRSRKQGQHGLTVSSASGVARQPDHGTTSSNPLTTDIVLPPSKETSVPTHSSQSAASRRSQSPVRRSDLARLAEPITFGTADVDLPSDVASLQPGLDDLFDQDGILPACLKDEASFVSTCKGVRSRMFATHGTDLEIALDEFKEVLKIVKATEKAVRRGFLEPAWNDTVHSRVLELALTPLDTVEWNNITAARLLPVLRPQFMSAFSTGPTQTTSPVANKMVDYSINLQPEKTFMQQIYSALSFFNTNTINQTNCESVSMHPAAISIETKTDRTGVADADVKLAVWMAAWRARMINIIPRKDTHDEVRCITQLGITVIGDVWKLYMLVDRGRSELGCSELEFLEFRKAIGNTSTVLGVYQLIAVLRHLCKWADEHLRSWLKDVFIY